MGKILVYYYLRNCGKGLEALLDINPMASGLLLVAGSEHSTVHTTALRGQQSYSQSPE